MLQRDIRFKSFLLGLLRLGNPAQRQLTLISLQSTNEQQIAVLFNNQDLNKCIHYLALCDIFHLSSETSPSFLLRLPKKTELKKGLAFAPMVIPRCPPAPFLPNTQLQGPPARALGRLFSWQLQNPPAELLLNLSLPKVTQQRRGDLPQCPDIFHGSF